MHSSLESFQYGTQGPWVMLLHGAASHSGQWKALLPHIEPHFRVIAFNQYGYGHSPSWTLDRPLTLQDQIKPLVKWIKETNEPIHLVGHSHGATLATLTAIQVSDLVQSLSLYEPNTFRVLDPNDPEDKEEYLNTKEAFGHLNPSLFEEKNHPQFAEGLLNFWLGEGQWDRLPSPLQKQLIAFMPPTLQEVHAVIYDDVSIDSFSVLHMPTLLMYDPQSPKPAQHVVKRYQQLLPNCTAHTFEGLGHLAPIHSAQHVNPIILKHLLTYRSSSRS